MRMKKPVRMHVLHTNNVGIVALDRWKGKGKVTIPILAASIGIQIGIGTEIDEKTRNSTPIAISISTVRMCSKFELLGESESD
jgi:hypothetical protein